MTPPHSTAERLVYSAMIDVHEIRSRFWAQVISGDVAPSVHLEFQSAIMDYYDELKRYRGRVEENWRTCLDETKYQNDLGLDILPKLVGKKTRIENRTDKGGIKTRKTEDRPARLPPRDLLMISYKLDDIATELNFATDHEPPAADPDEAVV